MGGSDIARVRVHAREGGNVAPVRTGEWARVSVEILQSKKKEQAVGLFLITSRWIATSPDLGQSLAACRPRSNSVTAARAELQDHPADDAEVDIPILQVADTRVHAKHVGNICCKVDVHSCQAIRSGVHLQMVA